MTSATSSSSHALRWVAVPLFLSHLVASQSLDLGKLDQYKGKDGIIQGRDLKGETLWVSGQDNSGFDIVLSGDLQNKVDSTVGGDDCKDKGKDKVDACYQALRRTLEAADLQVDDKLEKADFYRLVSRNVVLIAGLIGLVAILVVSNLNVLNAPVFAADGSFHIPQATASQAGSVDMGKPLTLSAEGSSIAVVTPSPTSAPAPTQDAPAPPTMTHLTKDDKDYKVGDVLINLSADEAKRISDTMDRMGCSDKDKDKRRSLASGLSAASCAVPAILQQVRPDGPLAEMRNYRPLGAPLRFRGAEVVRAANQALDVGRQLTSIVGLAPDLMAHLAMLIFALAKQRYVDNQAIGETNWIHGSTLQDGDDTQTQTQSSTATSSSCTSKMCTASCSQIGIIEGCQTTCTTATTACQANNNNQPAETVVTATTSFWAWDALPTNLLKKQPERTCNNFKDNKYVQLDTAEQAVSKFCDDDAVRNGRLDQGSGSIVRRYFEKTPGAIQVSIDFAPGLTYKTSKEDCVATLMSVVNGCDVPHDSFNAGNWKSGGGLAVFFDDHAEDNRPPFNIPTNSAGWSVPDDPNKHEPDNPPLSTTVNYWVTPLSQRKGDPSSMQHKQGHCHVDWTFGMFYNGVEVWGAGWAETDNGDALQQQLRGCALFPLPAFHLDYEQNLADKDKHGDGREWTAYFRTGVGQRSCTGHAIESAGGFTDGCAGGGA